MVNGELDNLPDCEERATLFFEYESAVAEYSRTVTFLYKRIGTLPRDVYKETDEFCDQARVRAEDCRIALEEHTLRHG